MAITQKGTNHEAEIRDLIDRFANAFRAKDVDGIMSFFAPEIVSFDILPPLAAVGADAFVKHWEEFFDSHQGLIHVEFPIKGTLKNGQQTDWWLRWTACYRKTNGKWLIVHEHVSVPADLGTGKALLDLKP